MGRKPKSANLHNLMFQSPSVHETTTIIPVTKRKSKFNYTSTRKSQRLKILARLAEDRQNEIVNEPINLDESEREDELEIVQIDEPIPCGKSLEEKVDQLVEDVEILKSKVNETDIPSDGSSELNYKTLYIRSQKKHEKGKDFVAKLKEVLESNLTKATETLVKLSSEVVFAASPSQPDCAIASKILTNEKRHKKPIYSSQPDCVIAPETQANEKRHKNGSK